MRRTCAYCNGLSDFLCRDYKGCEVRAEEASSRMVKVAVAVPTAIFASALQDKSMTIKEPRSRSSHRGRSVA